ncbi:MAG TPA: diguanylate cyclase, partial [Thermoanaerobaculia bacterium]|nr:diguanylate cyclase [Thermoanaerobaculia bacterium]
ALTLFLVGRRGKRARAGAALVGSAQRIVMEDIQTPILMLDLERRVIGANPFGTVLLGLERGSLPRPVNEVWPGWPVNPLQPIGEVEIELLGESFYFAAQECSIPGPDGTAVGTVVVLSDITERKELEHRLAELAARDPLTNAWNRRAFEEQAAGVISWARRHGAGLCLALCDLDRFKRLNDEHGHLAGDRALVAFHAACAAQLRASDLLARLGGDEFAVLLAGSSFEESRGVLERLRSAVARTDVEGLPQLEITTSLGAAYADNAATLPAGWQLAELLERADEALYESKRGGRNRCTMRGIPTTVVRFPARSR